MTSEKQRLTFISYSRTNKDFAVRLAKELKSSGFSVWLDQLDIPTGSRWDDELEKALEECEIFMVILTPASMASDNVKDEIGYAIDNHKRILPVLLENATIPFRLRRFQYVDFTTKSYDEGIESARQLLRSLVNQPTIPKSPIPAISQDQQALTEVKEEDERLKQKIEEERRVRAKVELERRAKEEREPTELAARNKVRKEANKPSRLTFGTIVGLIIGLILCGYAAIRFLTSGLGGATLPTPTEFPASTESVPKLTPSPSAATTGDNVYISSVSPSLGTVLKSGQPVDFEFRLHYNLVSSDQAALSVSIAQMADSTEKCRSQSGQLIDPNYVIIDRGEGDVSLQVTWHGGDNGKGEITTAGYLAPAPSLLKTDLTDRIFYFWVFEDYCYPFAP